MLIMIRLDGTEFKVGAIAFDRKGRPRGTALLESKEHLANSKHKSTGECKRLLRPTQAL